MEAKLKELFGEGMRETGTQVSLASQEIPRCIDSTRCAICWRCMCYPDWQ